MGIPLVITTPDFAKLPPIPDHPLDPNVTYHHGRLVGETHDAHLVIRVRPGEGEDGTCAATLLASCTTLEAAESAYRLMSGESVYPLWRERQEWAR